MIRQLASRAVRPACRTTFRNTVLSQQARWFSKFYTKSDEWFKVDGNSITIGITNHAQDSLGEIVYVDAQDVGKKVRKKYFSQAFFASNVYFRYKFKLVFHAFNRFRPTILWLPLSLSKLLERFTRRLPARTFFHTKFILQMHFLMDKKHLSDENFHVKLFVARITVNNDELADSPGKINEAAEEDGWICWKQTKKIT